MLPESVGSKAARNQFYQAARIYAKAVHPNLVKVFEAGLDSKGAPFMVMEFLPGGTLGDKLLEHHVFSPAEAAEIGIAVSRALTATSKLGIVHRDVKPDNIMTSAEGVYKLTDLSLAKLDASSAMLGNCARVLDEDAPVHTLPATGFGTLEYMSPEQYLDSESCDVRSDIYSLGVTLYHLAAGRLPFETAARTELRRMHMSVEPLVPSTFAPGIPIDFDYIVLRCLQKSPADRYQTPEELLEDLEAFLSGQPLPSTTCGAQPAVLTPPPASPSSRNRTPQIIFALVAAVLILLILVFALMMALMSRNGTGMEPHAPDRMTREEEPTTRETAPRTLDAEKMLKGANVTIIDEEQDEQVRVYFADVRESARRALAEGHGYRHAIDDLENYRSSKEFSVEAVQLIERLQEACDNAVIRLMAVLDDKAREPLEKGDYETAMNVYRTDIGKLAADAEPILNERIKAIRKQAGLDDPEEESDTDADAETESGTDEPADAGADAAADNATGEPAAPDPDSGADPAPDEAPDEASDADADPAPLPVL